MNRLNEKILSKFNLTEPKAEDYAKMNRKKNRMELVLLSLVVFGIEICYAAETAFVSPILQKIGVPLQFMSMVWGLSPLIGFLACPILGSLSDSFASKLGRRRPFILIYSLGIIIGLILLGYSHSFGDFLNSNKPGINPYVIVITILGVVLLDFDCDACQSPARAFLIDISKADDHSIGLSTFTIMAGAGGALGYCLGGIPWADLFSNNSKLNSTSLNGSFLQHDTINLSNDHKQILFTFVAVIYVVCVLVSISSFKEANPNGASSYEMLDELSNSESENCESKMCDNKKASINKSENLKYYLASIVKMPSSLKWLCLTHYFCWSSLLCFSLYFTDFVGEEIYGGDPSGSLDLARHDEYNKGVRFGSFCMALYSISCSIFSFFLQFLIKVFRTKYVYIFSQLIYSVGMLLLALSKSILIVPITSITAGIMYSSLFTIPFILVANYHSAETFELLTDSDEPDTRFKERRGLGTDLSIISSMVFFAQFILSFFMGTLMKTIGTKTVVIYAASVFASLAAFSSTRILYFD